MEMAGLELNKSKMKISEEAASHAAAIEQAHDAFGDALRANAVVGHEEPLPFLRKIKRSAEGPVPAPDIPQREVQNVL
jgi:hypothetical protein